MNNLLILCYQKYCYYGSWIIVPEEYYLDYIEGTLDWGGNSSIEQFPLIEKYTSNGFILACSLEQNYYTQIRKYYEDSSLEENLKNLYNHFIKNKIG